MRKFFYWLSRLGQPKRLYVRFAMDFRTFNLLSEDEKVDCIHQLHRLRRTFHNRTWGNKVDCALELEQVEYSAAMDHINFEIFEDIHGIYEGAKQ